MKTYSPPPILEREVLRYALCKEPSFEVENLLHEVITECEGALSYRVCFRIVPVQEGELILGEKSVSSESLTRHLLGCERAILFAATIGMGMDRLLQKYSRLSSAKAVLLQALGAERVEALCDEFEKECKEEEEKKGNFTRSRFSPGYGDFPLSAQKEILSLLDASRKIGVTLNESFLMSPSKSVTALIGVGKQAEKEEKESNPKCGACEKTDCAFRREE